MYLQNYNNLNCVLIFVLLNLIFKQNLCLETELNEIIPGIDIVENTTLNTVLIENLETSDELKPQQNVSTDKVSRVARDGDPIVFFLPNTSFPEGHT